MHPFPSETMVVSGWLSLAFLRSTARLAEKRKGSCLHDLFLRLASIKQHIHLFRPFSSGERAALLPL